MSKSLARRFGAFYFLLFVPVGLQAPYLFLFFKRQGFTNSELGTLAAVAPLLTVLSPPLWGAVADSLRDRRWMLRALLVCGGLTFPWLMWAGSFEATLVLLMVFSAFAFAPGAIADAMALESVERGGGDYAKLRLWGSVGFAAPLLALGLVLKRGAGEAGGSLYPIFIGYTLFRFASVGWVGLLPSSRGSGRGLLDARAVRVFVNGRFIALAGCAVVAMGAMSAYYMYFSIYLDEVGIADNMKGYFWAIAVAAETGMMWVIGRVIGRIGVKWTFVLSIAGCAARLLAFSFPLGMAGIAAAQCLHALTFAAFMVSTITFVNRLVPQGLRASGQTAWMALTMGLGPSVGGKLAGAAAGALGLMGMFRVFSLAAAAAGVAAAVLVKEQEEKREGN